uniref:Uncharacterized protein n=1 Tax=Arundo donax TaxID=35708 RepID=A0A0A9CAA7_ARUDO
MIMWLKLILNNKLLESEQGITL